MIDKKAARLRRASQTRRKIHELAKVRLAVHRTNTHIYAQLRAGDGKVLTSASTVEKEVRTKVSNGGNKAAAVAASKRLRSTAPATSTTAGSKRWQTRREKPASSSRLATRKEGLPPRSRFRRAL